MKYLWILKPSWHGWTVQNVTIYKSNYINYTCYSRDLRLIHLLNIWTCTLWVLWYLSSPRGSLYQNVMPRLDSPYLSSPLYQQLMVWCDTRHDWQLSIMIMGHVIVWPPANQWFISSGEGAGSISLPSIRLSGCQWSALLGDAMAHTIIHLLTCSYYAEE